MNIRLDRDTDRPNRRQPVMKSRSSTAARRIKIIVIIVVAVAVLGMAAAGIYFAPTVISKLKEMKKQEPTTAAPVSQSVTQSVPYTGFVETDARTGKSSNAYFDGSLYTLKQFPQKQIFGGDLILVNNIHAYDFEQSDSDNVNIFGRISCSMRSSDMELSERIIEPLDRLVDDFYKQTGLKTLNITSAYRDYETQEILLKNKIEAVGEKQAKKLITEPGHTEHHTGLAIDFGIYKDGLSYDYDGTGDYAWINKNCCDYGFVVRYDAKKASVTGIDNEPWHFRYVGVPHAYIMYKNHLCLEEYIDYLKRFTFGKSHLVLNTDKYKYEIFYCKDLSANVPTDCEYTVSGNNIDGLIVTVKRPVA